MGFANLVRCGGAGAFEEQRRRMVIPVGGESYQELLRVRKREGQTKRRTLYGCRFVPLVGIHGWGRPLFG